MPGWPKVTFRALDAGRREYEVRVQARPGEPAEVAGRVQRSGSLPSCQRWQAFTGNPLTMTGYSRDTRDQSARGLVSCWLAARHAGNFTPYTRQVIVSARESGRTVTLDMAEDPRLVRVTIDGPGRESLFGAFYVSAAHGTIIRGFFCYGNDGPERRYEGAQAVRQVIASWAALERSSQHA